MVEQLTFFGVAADDPYTEVGEEGRVMKSRMGVIGLYCK
jgi:hypothetical protein